MATSLNTPKLTAKKSTLSATHHAQVMVIKDAGGTIVHTSFFHDGARLAKFDDLLDSERNGVPAKSFVRIPAELGIPPSRVFQFTGIPKSTAAHKIKNQTNFMGTEALASMRLDKLLTAARGIFANSLHQDAKKMDSGKWLGQWLERPQPALGGIKPAELLDTEVGGQRVLQVLNAIESGSYQ